MFSSHHTLLYISRERIARCDVSARGAVTAFASRARPVASEVATLVDAALRLVKRRPGKVWVLSEEFWSQKISIPAELLAGLSPEEASRALAFEAESLSGQAALDAELRSLLVGAGHGREEHWVTTIPAWVRQQTDEVVRKLGGRLAGLLHPGGLPIPLSPETHGAWFRLEAWNGVLIGVGSRAPGDHAPTLICPDTRNAAVTQAIAGWQASFGNSQGELLTDGRRALPAEARGRSLLLADDETLKNWLTAWAGVLRSGSSVPVPVIVPAPQPLSGQQRLSLALGVAAVVAGIALFDGLRTYSRLEMLDGELQANKKRTDDLAAIKKQMTALAKEKTDLESHVKVLSAEVPKAEAAARAYRERWTALLTAASSECPRDLVVREITGKNNDAAIRGVSLGMEPLNQFGATLAQRLRPYGWTISPTYKSLPSEAGQPVLYEFSLKLVETSVIVPARAENLAESSTPGAEASR